MRLSSLNIFKTWGERNAQQQKEVKENSKHPKKTWKIWKHNRWGDSIDFNDWQRRGLTGHTTPLPKKGDIFHSKMRSGKVMAFELVKVEYCGDPSDMWFGTVKDVGYVE